jgi:MYXO-CTERM domain-containing protein
VYFLAAQEGGMNKRVIAGAVVWASSTLAAASADAQIVVAVENGPGVAAAANETAAQLNDDTFFNFTATVVPATGLDSAAELAAYDVVILGDSGSNDNDHSQAMASALVTALQSGALGVVTAGWFDYSTQALGPDATLDDVTPIDASPSWYNFCGSGVTINIANPNGHPVTAGLPNAFVTSSNNVEYTNLPLDAAMASVLGIGNNGACGNVIVVGQNGNGRMVYLGLVYMANAASYNNGDLRNGSADRLLEQAVNWASGGVVVPNCMVSADCDDFDVCTGTETCVAGFCQPGAPLVCNDNNVCTTDTCNAVMGCQFPPNNLACDDLNLCTTNDACNAGQCGGVPAVCDDMNDCTADTCNVASGCIFTPQSGACDDGDPCSVDDMCTDGTCSGGPADCDDMNPCTTDTCVPGTGCSSTPNTNGCNDSDVCTEDDVCNAGACAGTEVPNCCSDDSECDPGLACHPVTHVCIPDSSSGGGGAGGGGGEAGSGTGNDDDDDDEKDTRVESGCGCRTAAPPDDAAGLLALGLAAFAMRRRRSRR